MPVERFNREAVNCLSPAVKRVCRGLLITLVIARYKEPLAIDVERFSLRNPAFKVRVKTRFYYIAIYHFCTLSQNLFWRAVKVVKNYIFWLEPVDFEARKFSFASAAVYRQSERTSNLILAFLGQASENSLNLVSGEDALLANRNVCRILNLTNDRAEVLVFIVEDVLDVIREGAQCSLDTSYTSRGVAVLVDHPVLKRDDFALFQFGKRFVPAVLKHIGKHNKQIALVPLNSALTALQRTEVLQKIIHQLDVLRIYLLRQLRRCQLVHLSLASHQYRPPLHLLRKCRVQGSTPCRHQYRQTAEL